MNVDLRSLYARVGIHRPDLPEATYGYVIREAAKKMIFDVEPFRDTFGFDTVIDKWEYPVDYWTVTPSSGYTWDSSRTPMRIQECYFYNTVTLKWDALEKTNLESEKWMNKNFYQQKANDPRRFAENAGNIYLVYTPAAVRKIKFVYTYNLTDEIETIDITEGEREAIINFAISEILLHGGQGRDLQASEAFRQKYESAAPELRFIRNYGQSGNLWMSPVSRF